jgi:hypothetical protein
VIPGQSAHLLRPKAQGDGQHEESFEALVADSFAVEAKQPTAPPAGRVLDTAADLHGGCVLARLIAARYVVVRGGDVRR